jgi:EAL domain-containing protein (putative c-di-GMP-specific phosphodiesterase class I)/CHASE3 domain sensor protein
VRKLGWELRRWSSRHGDLLATVGLAAVLVLLAGFSLWAAVRTNAAARQVDRDNTEQRVWQTALLDLAEAESAQHAYMQHRRADALGDFTQATVAVRIALGYIARHADPDDVAFTRQVETDYRRYRQASGRLMAAVATGDGARARVLDAREVGPAFTELAEGLAEGASNQEEQVDASLAAQRRLGRTLAVAAPVAFTVGLVLLVGCWLLVGYRRRIRQQALSDALTGLPNRTLLHDRTTQALRQADRELAPAGLLLLHYQPKIDAHSGQVLGVEALVRWQHPEYGLVPPGDFIPLAERTGLIGPLTHYVLDAALDQCSRWRRDGHELPVAVNVSARRLLDLAFPDEVAELLARWQVHARLLVVEITESTIMADPTHAMQILGRLNQMGVQVSIDDFGTGYSSMAYLKSLPIHELKVDRSFVMQMTSSSRDAVIVRSTVELGRNLGLRVVAEGVEDQHTLQELDALGCDAVQGYHVSRPVPPDQLISWLEQHAARPTPQPHP